MNETEYYLKVIKIKNRNHAWFAGIVGGLAGLTLVAGLHMRSPDVSYEQKRRIYDYAYSLSSISILTTSAFFMSRERRQLRELEEEYREKKRKR